MGYTFSASEEVEVRGLGRVNPYTALDPSRTYRLKDGNVLYHVDRIGWKSRLPSAPELVGDWLTPLAKLAFAAVLLYLLLEILRIQA